MELIHIHPSDNVAVALTDLKKGESYDLEGTKVTPTEDIARGHKVALCAIPAGEPVI